jgi:prephenate dehydrogenase
VSIGHRESAGDRAGEAVPGPVLVVGAGLLGTSIGLALRRQGVEVLLSDRDPRHVAIASGMGAGTAEAGTESPAPTLVVVAVPPDHLADQIADALTDGAAVVTDVGSVKASPLAAVAARVPEDALGRYVGSHPMAGSERSGPFAATGTLFDGRPWAVTPHPGSRAAAVDAVVALAHLCGAVPMLLDPAEHDQAVARTSHLPHLLAALAAGRLVDAPARHLVLSGQGVRDVTRVAAGDPVLWQQIVASNAAALAGLLDEVRDDLERLLAAVRTGDRATVGELLSRGVAGTGAIPGKHGGAARPTAEVFVAVPDHPGELARLLADAGEIGVNVEDLHIDHDPGRPVGVVDLTVDEESAELLESALRSRGWTTHR